MGIFAPAEVEGVKFGSLGVAVDVYRTVVLAEKSEEKEVSGIRAEDAARFAETFAKKVGITGYKLRVLNAAPAHVGLGSSTQLALSVTSAISKLYNLNFDPIDLSRILGRGKVSGVGTFTHKFGGFVVERSLNLIARLNFPKDWKFIVAIPEGAGLHGKKEEEAFKNLKPKPNLTYRACFLVLMKILPSLASRDFDLFTSSIEELQKTVGEMFSDVQGGVYSQKTAEAIEVMKSLDLKGVGQSSWGPSAYGLVFEKDALEKYDDVRKSLKGKVFLCSADNFGAVVEVC